MLGLGDSGVICERSNSFSESLSAVTKINDE